MQQELVSADGRGFVPCLNEAEMRRAWFERWLRGLGFDVPVPSLRVSDVQVRAWHAGGREAFYRPPERLMTCERFLRAVNPEFIYGPSDGEVARAVRRSVSEMGYWFVADAVPQCPRRGIAWKSLYESDVQHLSPTEYLLLAYALRAANGTIVDAWQTWTFVWPLRTDRPLLANAAHGHVTFSAAPESCLGGDSRIGSRDRNIISSHE